MANQSVVPCGIGLPQVFRDGPVDVRLVRDFATRAEGLGYHSLWVQAPAPAFELSFWSYSCLNVISNLAIHEPIDVVLLRKPLDELLPMFIHSTHEFIGHDVDIVLGHWSLLAYA